MTNSPEQQPTRAQQLTAEKTSKSKKPSRRTVLIGSLAVLAGAGGGAGWALDRFVVEHVEQTGISSAAASTASTASDTAAKITDTSYTSDLAKINITKTSTGSGSSQVTYFAADIKLSEGTVLGSAFAKDSFGENITETTSTIAENNNAIFAINGDYYGFRDTGIVIRNGVAYRDKGAREGLAFYKDGSVKTYDETTTSADALVADGVWQTLSFGPTVVKDSKQVDGIDQVEVDTNFGNHSIQGQQPRTAIGVIDDNHFVFVVVDGRSEGYSVGVTMPELAQIMLDLGCETAYNIDGGGSSTMYFNGSLVNNPLGRNQERGTSDILFIAGQG
ncbi:phosphodiester glycosidase family protein [Glutamicibacter sp. JC586]|uniref:phosphodiester glycosidase family protein n=1 Tax=Glutamicibacter sp. JC586 TaxID=2590552 RepID=UPI0013587E1E|nr:phosphodiester glycosidase family protein [Glutamicibacter sp. JC586]